MLVLGGYRICFASIKGCINSQAMLLLLPCALIILKAPDRGRGCGRFCQLNWLSDKRIICLIDECMPVLIGYPRRSRYRMMARKVPGGILGQRCAKVSFSAWIQRLHLILTAVKLCTSEMRQPHNCSKVDCSGHQEELARGNRLMGLLKRACFSEMGIAPVW